jgi:holo-[acyl-carrier protein] synthase
LSIVGIGTDIVAVERVATVLARHGDRFLNRCFPSAERRQLEARQGRALTAAVAGRWAAKEAFLKALGGSITHIPYHEVAVLNNADGVPRLVVTGTAAAELSARGGRLLHLTISHEREYAVATVMIER